VKQRLQYGTPLHCCYVTIE